MDLSVNLAGIELEHPLMNAAGTCKTFEEVIQLSRSASSAIVVGSITLEARIGNAGFSNPGAAYYREYFPLMRSYAHDHGKPLFVSVAGFSPEEYVLLTELAFSGGADLLELNLGCLTIVHGVERMSPACFDSSLVRDILVRVERAVRSRIPVAVKISPFSNSSALAEFARTIGGLEVVRVVTAINAPPNTFVFGQKGSPGITPHGGFVGPALRPIGLRHVQWLRSLVPPRIQIVGVGGIVRGEDILEYRWRGADAVQIATAYLEHKEGVFISLLSEFINSMDI